MSHSVAGHARCRKRSVSRCGGDASGAGRLVPSADGRRAGSRWLDQKRGDLRSWERRDQMRGDLRSWVRRGRETRAERRAETRAALHGARGDRNSKPRPSVLRPTATLRAPDGPNRTRVTNRNNSAGLPSAVRPQEYHWRSKARPSRIDRACRSQYPPGNWASSGPTRSLRRTYVLPRTRSGPKKAQPAVKVGNRKGSES